MGVDLYYGGALCVFQHRNIISGYFWSNAVLLIFCVLFSFFAAAVGVVRMNLSAVKMPTICLERYKFCNSKFYPQANVRNTTGTRRRRRPKPVAPSPLRQRDIPNQRRWPCTLPHLLPILCSESTTVFTDGSLKVSLIFFHSQRVCTACSCNFLINFANTQ